MDMTKISEIEQAFKEIFKEEDGVVKSVETVYEEPENGDFLKLIICIHGLSTEDINIVHTKFIFKTDKEKINITDNYFIYLYDINCIYHRMEFESIIDMKEKIEGIIESNNFGENLQIISDFTETPAQFLNYYMKREKITEYSVFDVEYEPKFKTTPCDKTTFDFKININNNYTIDLSIRKVEVEDEADSYKFQFKFMDKIETVDTDSLKNIHFFIGKQIARLLDEKVKSNNQ
jgi:hypothetical protein